MMSEKALVDEKSGKLIGFELEGRVLDVSDCGVLVEIRPVRASSVTIEIGFFEGSFPERPHAGWHIGEKVRVLIFK